MLVPGAIGVAVALEIGGLVVDSEVDVALPTLLDVLPLPIPLQINANAAYKRGLS